MTKEEFLRISGMSEEEFNKIKGMSDENKIKQINNAFGDKGYASPSTFKLTCVVCLGILFANIILFLFGMFVIALI